MGQYRNVNVRSPWFVQFSTTEVNAQCDVYLWYGEDVADKPADPEYTLIKEATDGYVTFEVAELMRDWCIHTSQRESGTVWAEVVLSDADTGNADVTETYLVSEGYALYTEGLRHQGNSYDTDFVALPEMIGRPNEFVISSPNTIPLMIPIFTQPQDSVSWRWRYYIGATPQSWTILDPSPNNDEQFRYIVAADVYDKIEFDFNGTIQKIYINKIDCNKFNTAQGELYQRPAVLMYVNKYGAKSEFALTLKRIESISASTDMFKRNVVDYAGFTNSMGLHAHRKRITGSKQSFVLNTDFMTEDEVRQIEEIILSEYVWLKVSDVSTNYFSVNLKDEKLVKKNHLNDKLIQFTFKVETASEYINTVR